jgi:hypothetical protein
MVRLGETYNRSCDHRFVEDPGKSYANWGNTALLSDLPNGVGDPSICFFGSLVVVL